MNRFAPTTALPDRKPPTMPAKQPAVSHEEDAQDRLGAQRIWEAGQANKPADALTEIAVIVQRLLGSQGQMLRVPRTPAPVGADKAGTEEPEAKAPDDSRIPQPKQDTAEPGVTSVPQGGHAEAKRVLLGKPGPTTGEAIEVPKFEQRAQVPLKPQQGGTEEKPAAAKPPVVPAAVPTAEVDGGDSHRMIVRKWQSGIRGAGGGMPMPKVAVNEASRAELRGAAQGAAKRNTAARKGMTEEAVNNVPAAPEVEKAPPPPPNNPVPGHTESILGFSDKRLPDQYPRPLVASKEIDVEAGVKVGGSLPRIGETPVSPDLFQVLITPGARDLAMIPTQAVDAAGKPNFEAKRLLDAIDQLSGKKPAERQGRGEQVISPDKGPIPMKPLPEHLQAPVGQVVARLLAQADETTTGVLDTLRELAYRGGVLKKNFPEAGKVMADGLKSAITTDLRDIAAAANISAEELDGMIAKRQEELAASTKTAATDAAQISEAASKQTAEEGQRTMDAIDGAAQAADEETLRRQEAASGAADPAVINRRRDLTVRWIREHVTTQITSYQQAGDKRVGELQGAQREQLGAYSALVQREQYAVMTPQPPRANREPSNAAREKLLADLAVTIRAWGDEQIAAVTESFRKKIAVATTTTKTYRKDIEGAGNAGIEAARQWAEDKVLENESWWDRFLARIRRWLSQANDANEHWRVRRTEQNRNAVAIDLQIVAAAQARLAAGLTQDEILADQSLSEAQRAVIQQYFQSKDQHPLDFAAKRLRTNTAIEHLEHARQTFEAELIATPVRYGDYDIVDKLNLVAQSQGGSFDAAKIAEQLRGAMDQIGTDEGQIFSSLRGLTPLRGAVVRKVYRARYGRDLDWDLQDEMGGDELAQAQAQLAGKQAQADAIALHDAISGIGTDEAAIMSTLRNKTPEEMEAIKAEYQSRYGESLDQALKEDLDEGNEIDQANALMKGDVATADAIALDDSMRGGFLGLGTAEKDVEKVYTRTREEVLQRAQAEHWTSQQMEAEMRRRLAAIEAKFGERYKNVEQYNAPGLKGGSVLKRAFDSEMSGGELDLANALQDNNLIAADAARIEIERTGFYASDEKINGVLRSQYERALEATRLDEGPARRMRFERDYEEQAAKLRREGKSEDEVSRLRMKMERDMEAQLEDRAQKRSEITMGELKKVYEDKYFWPLSYVVSANMSGADRLAARDMLAQGGRLTALQEVEYATQDLGTEEAVLRRRLSTMTKAEIDKLAIDWERRHPGRSFKAMLRSELSGRDESDIMDMVDHGAPESASQRIDQERRRVNRELNDLTGVLGSAAAGPEEAWINDQLKRLEVLEAPLKRTYPPNAKLSTAEMAGREALHEQLDFRVGRVQDAVEDHRRRLDSFTDTVTMVIGIVVAVIAGAVSGGTLGALILAGLIASAASMAAKALIKGGSYGTEEIWTDVGVAAVDVAATALTAGMGKRLLGPITGLVSKAGGKIASSATAIARSKPVARIAATGIGQRVAGSKVGSAVGRVAAAAGRARPGLEKRAANFLSEVGEDIIGSAPSVIVQTAATDNIFKGDPLGNFFESGGMGLIQAVGMSRIMSPVIGRLNRSVRLSTPHGRLAEAGSMISAGHAEFQRQNPGASLTDFLAHPEGRKLSQQIEAEGLMPTADSIAKTNARKADAAKADIDMAALSPDAARADALTAGVPKNLRDGTFVTPDPDLPGRTVRVEPLRIGDRIVGVDIRVGPDASALDIALHAGVVHAMHRYRGVLGSVRQALENFGAMLSGSGLRVGSRGWEARLEMEKLPSIIASRMDELAGGAFTPDKHARALADIQGLEAQLNTHSAILNDPALRNAPGRGFVAAEADAPPKRMGTTTAEAEGTGVRLETHPQGPDPEVTRVTRRTGGEGPPRPAEKPTPPRRTNDMIAREREAIMAREDIDEPSIEAIAGSTHAASSSSETGLPSHARDIGDADVADDFRVGEFGDLHPTLAREDLVPTDVAPGTEGRLQPLYPGGMPGPVSSKIPERIADINAEFDRLGPDQQVAFRKFHDWYVKQVAAGVDPTIQAMTKRLPELPKNAKLEGMTQLERQLRLWEKRIDQAQTKPIREKALADLKDMAARGELPFKPEDIVSVTRVARARSSNAELISTGLRETGGAERSLSFTVRNPKTRELVQIDDFDVGTRTIIEIKSYESLDFILADAGRQAKLADQLRRHAELVRDNPELTSEWHVHPQVAQQIESLIAQGKIDPIVAVMIAEGNFRIVPSAIP